MAALRPRTLALGTWLAARGALATLGLALALVGALGSVVLAVASDGGEGAARLPLLESSALAWSAGLVLALGASLRAVARDQEQGVLALARARGATVAAYVRGRVGGVVLLVGGAVGGATLVGTLAAASVAHPRLAAARIGGGALAYALVFAATVGPLAMATLGARTRSGGTLTLLAILGLPELLAPWTSALLPSGWHELTSIPAALAAVRTGVIAPVAMGLPMTRALAGLAAVVAVSLVIVAARASSAEARGTP